MNTGRTILIPNRHVVAVFTYIALLPLVYYIPPWLVQHVTNDHLLITVLALAIIVPIISYIALPVLFKLFELVNGKALWINT